MLNQVEFLLQGPLLPLTIGRLHVSPSFRIEGAAGEKTAGGSFALAFVGVMGEGDIIRKASSRVEFFVLLYALATGHAVTSTVGGATCLSTLDDLGKNRISFPSYERATRRNEDFQSVSSKPILLTKERFLQLEEDKDRILDEYVGLALTYYYYAVRASKKGSPAEVVTNLAIAAEALFSKEQPYTAHLERRLSGFIAHDEFERKEITKRIGEFYRLKEAVVRGEKRGIPPADVRRVSEYIRRAIDKALSSKLFTKAQLIQEVDKF